jgi:hypothetical protein
MHAELLPHYRIPRLAASAGPPVVAMTHSVPTCRQFRIVRVETMAVAAADPCCDHGPQALVPELLVGDRCHTKGASGSAGRG